MSRAVVLGGGGAVGIAWESGIAAGLERRGVSLGEADVIVGTSAGSVVGAQLALGRSGEALLGSQVDQARRAGGGSGDAQPAPALDASGLFELMATRPVSGEPPAEWLAEVGAFALQAETGSEQDFIAGFGYRIGSAGTDGWPEGFACTAIDALDGSFTMWRRDSGIELARAVASSCAVPGVFPPITIDGRRYFDGGIRSPTNGDLAKGHDTVLVIAVVTPMTDEVSGARLEAELDALRADGSEVALIVPDEEAAATFGTNLLDGSLRDEVAEAGARQGEQEAERLREFWA